jgi:hypothetical protein
MKLQTIGRILLGAIICMAIMSGKSLNAQSYDIERMAGVSGNLFDLPGENKYPVLGGLGARARAAGDYEEFVLRAGAEGYGGAGTNKSWTYGAQARLGIGGFREHFPLYLMGMIDADFDGVKCESNRKSARVIIIGGETGKYIYSDRRTLELMAGANVGVAIIRADTGAKLPDSAQSTTAELDGKISRHVLSTGLSLTLTTGKDGQIGGLQVQCTGAALWRAGWQSSCSGDVNVSKHIQLGAGYRYSKLRSNEDEKMSIITPFFRITFGRSAKEDLNP